MEKLIIHQTPTIAQMIFALLDTEEIAREAKKLNVELENYQNFLIELSSDLAMSSFLEEEGGNTGGTYLQKPLSYASCYPTSVRLLTLMGTDVEKTQKYGQGGINKLKAVVQSLVDDIQEKSKSGKSFIYRIACAEHGFILIVRNNKVEHLESFAKIGILLQSIKENRSYTIENVCTYLTNLVNDDWKTRDQVASKMGWNAGPIGVGQGANLSKIRFDWDCAPLADDLGIRITSQIDLNREIILENYKK